MEFRHLLSRDEDKKTATLLLYGDIGGKVDGDFLAQEIQYLEKEVDAITLRINSAGGSVIQGLSIFNAILNSPAHITVHIDGIAASMAGVIPMAADRVLINDFGRIMIHDPYFSGKKDAAEITPKEQKTIGAARGILASLLSRRGMEATRCEELMAEETWFTAQEALDAKLVDEIIKTDKKKQVDEALQGFANLAAEHFTPYIHQNTNQTATEMKTIIAMMGMDAAATEAQVLNEIRTLTQERDAFKAKATAHQATIDQLQSQIQESQTAEIDVLVAKAIDSGHFEATAKDLLATTAKADLANFRQLVEGLKPMEASLSATLRASTEEPAGEKKDFQWMRENDPEGLAEMKASQPAAFAKLYDAWAKANA